MYVRMVIKSFTPTKQKLATPYSVVKKYRWIAWSIFFLRIFGYWSSAWVKLFPHWSADGVSALASRGQRVKLLGHVEGSGNSISFR